ncbi:hypothetical protein PEBR_10511 [Penicillium brasilianum]|uniref:Uncharacterized protein n=1 Tax=Penicillium brasilianum TaxID=104259 RepID=A0A1S9RUA3_PENBI|nr:hypothetical protein PEBR_10511 [Penicillium brasilianum]
MTVTNALHANDSSNGSSASPAPKRLLLVSVPRTASNLLLKILNIAKQPHLLTNPRNGYFFYPAFSAAAQDGTLAKEPGNWSTEEKQRYKANLQRCLNELEDYSTRAQTENKVMFAKEHAFWIFNPAAQHKMTTGEEYPEFFEEMRVDIADSYGPRRSYSKSNETCLSDQYLRSWQMAFIIRHPALAWPSMYRAMKKLAAQGFIDEDGVKGSSLTNMSFRWTRLLYDWCLEQPDVPTPPPVVDAHDLIHSPEIILQFCDHTGLDKECLQFEWCGNDYKKSQSWAAPDEVANAAELDMHLRAASIMLSTLEASKGIVKDKAPEKIDIAAEAAKWKVEFGEEIAGLVEKAVRDSMPDYEYLKARRLTV